jgi:Dyp-type peroxidase family
MAFDRSRGEPQLELHEIQGDSLVGLQKDFEWFLFFTIQDEAKFKEFIRTSLVQRITTAARAFERELQIKAHKAAGYTHKLTFIGFSISGLQKLHLPNLDRIADDSFKQGIAARSAALGDPKEGPGSPSTWKVGGRDNAADGVVIITGPTPDAVDRARRELLELAGTIWKISYEERGMTRQLDRGHEHFGFLDGVSQPGVRGQIDHTFPGRMFLQDSQNSQDPGQGLPGADLLWPGEFVFGYPGQKPDDIDNPGDIVRGGPDWMKNGSFMVFRRLNQLVPEFNKFIDDSAQTLGMDAEILGARLVGRWKSGAPLLITPLQDDPLLGDNELQNNAFEFDQDPGGRRCPFAAHIRKAYPRDDITPAANPAASEFEQREQSEANTQAHRILRRGIPFGPEVGETDENEEKNERTTTDRGLMFVCYQTSITEQFEFILQAWLNNPNFAPRGNEPGFDPLLGQFGDDPLLRRTVTQRDPRPFEGATVNYPTGDRGPTLSLPFDFIVPTGGGYFFVPSISTLKAF